MRLYSSQRRKSQLAIEYAYRVREQSPHKWIFWVHAGTQPRFLEGYRRIAEVAKLCGLNDPQRDLLRFVRNWLSDESNGEWVMIVDNADDLDVFFSPNTTTYASSLDSSTGMLSDLLPQSPNGSILITSRNRDVAFHLVGYYSDIIEVGPMDQTDALALAEKKLEGGFERKDAIALVEALDRIPLAIAQAAAYILRRSPRVTVSTYLQILQKGEADRMKLLDVDIGNARRDPRASNSIVATWQISFEHIRKEKRSAARLLSLMSLFDRHDIPESLLKGRYQESDDVDADFEDDLDMLSNFSLVKTNKAVYAFEMHQLVQISTRRWLQLNSELEEWKEKFVGLMDENFPDAWYNNFATCRPLFPHVQGMLEYQPSASWLARWASVLMKASNYADYTGDYAAALEIASKVQVTLAQRLEPDHLDVLTSTNKLAVTMYYLGSYEEAENLNRRALAGREKVLGPQDPGTLVTVNNLAIVLGYKEEYDEAENLSRRALEGRERNFGSDNAHTLTSVGNLGWVLQRQGKYEEAESLQRRAIAGCEKKFGPDDVDTLISVINLATILRDQDKFEEAEGLSRRALLGLETTLGSDHPYTMRCMYYLATILAALQKYEKATELFQKACPVLEHRLGASHPWTIDCQEDYTAMLSAVSQRPCDGTKQDGEEKDSELNEEQSLNEAVASLRQRPSKMSAGGVQEPK